MKRFRYNFPNTNSSSSHSLAVSVITDIEKIKKSVKEQLTALEQQIDPDNRVYIVKIDKDDKSIYLDTYIEFNSVFKVNESFIAKTLYCIALVHSNTQDSTIIEKQEERICKIFKDFTGYTLVLGWRNTKNTKFGSTIAYYTGAPSVDHQSTYNRYILEFTDEDIRNFIFNPESFLITSSDGNSDYDKDAFVNSKLSKKRDIISVIFIYNSQIDYLGQKINDCRELKEEFSSDCLIHDYFNFKIIDKVVLKETGELLLDSLIYSHWAGNGSYYPSFLDEIRKIEKFYTDKDSKKIIFPDDPNYSVASREYYDTINIVDNSKKNIFPDNSKYFEFSYILNIVDISDFSIYDVFLESSSSKNLFETYDYPIVGKFLNYILIPTINTELKRPGKYLKDYFLSENTNFIYVSHEILLLLKKKIGSVYLSRVRIYDEDLGFLY